MNKIKSVIVMATLLVASSVMGQSGIGAIVAGFQQSGLLSATNYSFEPYLTYAPNAPKHVGAGFLAIYNVNNYVGVGIGGDELGRFNLLSANATLQLPVFPLTFLHTTFTSNFAVVPFQLMGAGTPLSGTSSPIANTSGGVVIVDTGAYFQFGHVLGGQLNAGAAYGQWDNAGAYSGKRYHVFAGWSKRF